VLTFAVAPLTAYVALVFFERLDRIIGGARALSLFVFRRWAFLRLLPSAEGIREDILTLGRDVGVCKLPPGLHLLHESLRKTAPVGGALQRPPQIGVVRRGPWNRSRWRGRAARVRPRTGP